MPSSQKNQEVESNAVPLDAAVLTAAFGGDEEAEREVLRCFRESLDGDCAVLQAALARHDLVAASRQAHRLKGGCRMVGALPLAAVCERIETAGRANEAAAVAIEEPALRREIERLTRFLGEMPVQRRS